MVSRSNNSTLYCTVNSVLYHALFFICGCVQKRLALRSCYCCRLCCARYVFSIILVCTIVCNARYHGMRQASVCRCSRWYNITRRHNLQVGQHNEKRASYGHSLIVDPWGKVLADAGGHPSDSPCIATADIGALILMDTVSSSVLILYDSLVCPPIVYRMIGCMLQARLEHNVLLYRSSSSSGSN